MKLRPLHVLIAFFRGVSHAGIQRKREFLSDRGVASLCA